MNDMLPGVKFIHDGLPFEVISAHHYKREQRRPVMQAKVRNLITGRTMDQTFHTHHQIEEAPIELRPVQFVYAHRDKFVFAEVGDTSKRFELPVDVVGATANFLKTGMEVNAVDFDGTIINIDLPVKVDYTVTDAPPNVKGDTQSGGNKVVIIETGYEVKTPLFINTGDVIKVNTQTGEYVERVNKA
ncbi:MAG: hypothetical protein A2666_05060 [Parcubacteria group bacterium RIFCSPHIGHO2_01_FULL_47_10b]|nr:MAG: hypothetical protein A2666_05060 [Parcubacteria group bacterium RIFCSPHIGHO2_01_FULL_47_10b]